MSHISYLQPVETLYCRKVSFAPFKGGNQHLIELFFKNRVVVLGAAEEELGAK